MTVTIDFQEWVDFTWLLALCITYVNVKQILHLQNRKRYRFMVNVLKFHLIAAVDQSIGCVTIVTLVQDPTQKLRSPDHHMTLPHTVQTGLPHPVMDPALQNTNKLPTLNSTKIT